MCCPSCHRRIVDETICPRCQTPLGELIEVRRVRDQLLTAGRHHLQNRDFTAALRLFRRGRQLYDSRDLQRAESVALLCLGRFSEAINHMNHLQKEDDSEKADRTDGRIN